MSAPKNAAVDAKIDKVLDGGSVAPWERDENDTEDIAPPAVGETGIMIPDAAASALVEGAEEFQPGQMAYGETLDFELNELRIPFLRLGSGMTPEVKERKANEGQWLLQGHEPVDTVEFVVTGVTRFREFRDSVTQETFCRSGDGIVGVGAPGGICAKCPMALWGEKNPQTGKGTPPPCNGGYSYTVYSLTHQQPAILSFRKTQIAAAKVVNTMIHLRKVKNFVCIMDHKMIPSPVKGGMFPIPIIVGRRITEEERAEVDASLLPSAEEAVV